MANNSLQNFNYQGQLIQRRDDGFVNLTQMCQANGKQVNDFFRLKSTKEYLIALELETGIPVNQLQQVFQGSKSFGGGSWGHPLVALRLAQWISPKFAVWCDAHIFNLMQTGQTSLAIDPIAEMKLKIELARLERDKAELENRTINLRHTIVTTCPEPVQQKILGYQVVEKTEYRDRIIRNEEVIRDGTTVNKTQLCRRYGILTKNGKPDYRKLNQYLEKMPSEAFNLSAVIQENQELIVDFLPALDRLIENSERQLWLGE